MVLDGSGKKCGRNIEVMWLIDCLNPDHNKIARHFDLIGGKLIACDSTKIGTQNNAINIITFKQYRTSACKSCKAHYECTISKNGRLFHRTTFTEYYERNRKFFEEKERLYKRSQAIVVHPYGTIKTEWAEQAPMWG